MFMDNFIKGLKANHLASLILTKVESMALSHIEADEVIRHNKAEEMCHHIFRKFHKQWKPRKDNYT